MNRLSYQARTHAVVGLLVAITLLKGVLWSATVPFGQAPDEFSHYSMIQFIAEFGRLPEAGEIYMSDELVAVVGKTGTGRLVFHQENQQAFAEGTVGPNELEIRGLDPALRHTFETRRESTAHFVPPLYHALAALGYRLSYHQDLLSRLFAARLVSVLLTAGLVIVAYALAREVFPNNPPMWVTMATVVSFQPMVTFLGSVANSDILLFLLFGLATWLIVRALRCGLDWRIAAALGIIVGLGILTKPTLLTCGLGIAILFLVELARRRRQWRRILGMAVALVVLALLVSGWFMLRSHRIQGSPLYEPAVSNPTIRANITPRPDLSVTEYWSEIYYPALRQFTFNSYWGDFGWVDTPMPGGVYDVLHWACNLALIGLGVSTALALRRRPVPWSRLLLFFTLAVLSVSALPPVFLRGYTVARDTGFLYSSLQGRYQLTGWLAQATLLTAGLIGLFPTRLRPLAHFLLRAGIVALNAYALFSVVIPRYYVP